jgi:hypothetical protein
VIPGGTISVIERVRAQNPLPEGAISVGIGLVVSGIATYVFLGIAHRKLDPADYSALGVLWTAMFAIGNGIMQPLEQGSPGPSPTAARTASDRRR